MWKSDIEQCRHVYLKIDIRQIAGVLSRYRRENSDQTIGLRREITTGECDVNNTQPRYDEAYRQCCRCD